MTTPTPTTPETTRQRSEHLEAIRSECEEHTQTMYDVPYTEVPRTARIVQHAEAMQARIERLQRAFIAAESCCEQCAAYQDQTRSLWLQRWGLEDGDLPIDDGSN